jgi:hypothetical protein
MDNRWFGEDLEQDQEDIAAELGQPSLRDRLGPYDPTAEVVPTESTPVTEEIYPEDDLRERLKRAQMFKGVADVGGNLVETLTGAKQAEGDAGVGQLQKAISLRDKLAMAKSKGTGGYKFAKVVDKNSRPLYTLEGASGFFRQNEKGGYDPVNPEEVNYPASMSTEKKMKGFKDSGYVDAEGQPLLRQEKTGKYFKPGGKDIYSGVKFPKSFIERLVKEPGTDLTPVRLSYLKDTSKAYDSRVKTVETSIQSANELVKEIKRNGKMTLNVIRTKMPRLFGEVGNLNEFEQKVWSGSPELMNKLKTLISEKFDPNKTLEDRDREEFLEIIDIAMLCQQRMIYYSQYQINM